MNAVVVVVMQNRFVVTTIDPVAESKPTKINELREEPVLKRPEISRNQIPELGSLRDSMRLKINTQDHYPETQASNELPTTPMPEPIQKKLSLLDRLLKSKLLPASGIAAALLITSFSSFQLGRSSALDGIVSTSITTKSNQVLGETDTSVSVTTQNPEEIATMAETELAEIATLSENSNLSESEKQDLSFRLNELFEKLTKSINLHPDSTALILIRAELGKRVYSSATPSMKEQTDADYQTIIRLSPLTAEYHFKYGQFLEMTGQLKSSAAHIEEALHLNPKNVDYIYALCRIQIRLGQIAEAIDSYQQLLKLIPTTSPSYPILKKEMDTLKSRVDGL